MKNWMPKVKGYPICSECRTPFVLRLTYVLSRAGEEWLWMRACAHKKAVPVSAKAAARKDGGR
jgi:hypothetical protein